MPGFWRFLRMLSRVYSSIFPRSGIRYPSGGTRPYFRNDQRIIIDPGKKSKKPK
jgi:hypothetical protein